MTGKPPAAGGIAPGCTPGDGHAADGGGAVFPAALASTGVALPTTAPAASTVVIISTPPAATPGPAVQANPARSSGSVRVPRTWELAPPMTASDIATVTGADGAGDDGDDGVCEGVPEADTFWVGVDADVGVREPVDDEVALELNV